MDRDGRPIDREVEVQLEADEETGEEREVDVVCGGEGIIGELEVEDEKNGEMEVVQLRSL